MTKGKIVIISGPSGSGKTTLHKKLLLSNKLKDKLVKSVSATTRPPRSGEKDGRDYLFLNAEQFLAKKRTGHFLECQKVFDNYYGTPKKAVEQLLKKGQNVLLCIDVKGARTVARRYPDAIKIFIKVPSLTLLKKRLMSRGTETRNDLRLRLETARKEMREARHYNHTVINNDLFRALKKLEILILKELQKIAGGRRPPN